jgi:TM2 domain-containing membrane protein YozV
MKKLVLTLAVALFAICSASANNYVANDAAIDALVENSVEMVMEAAPAAPALDILGPVVKLVDKKDPLIATLLSWCTGWCGLHRYYLGTAKFMVVPYLLTGGGFGIVTFVDAVLMTLDLVQDNKINPKYINNRRILMWADLI